MRTMEMRGLDGRGEGVKWRGIEAWEIESHATGREDEEECYEEHDGMCYAHAFLKYQLNKSIFCREGGGGEGLRRRGGIILRSWR